MGPPGVFGNGKEDGDVDELDRKVKHKSSPKISRSSCSTSRERPRHSRSSSHGVKGKRSHSQSWGWGKSKAMDAQEALARRLERAKKIQDKREKEIQEKAEKEAAVLRAASEKGVPAVLASGNTSLMGAGTVSGVVGVSTVGAPGLLGAAGMPGLLGPVPSLLGPVGGLGILGSGGMNIGGMCTGGRTGVGLGAGLLGIGGFGSVGLGLGSTVLGGVGHVGVGAGGNEPNVSTGIDPQVILVAQLAVLQAQAAATAAATSGIGVSTGITNPTPTLSLCSPGEGLLLKSVEVGAKKKKLWQGKDGKSQTEEHWKKLNFGDQGQNAKFRKLMGIQQQAAASTDECLETLQQQEQVFRALDAQYMAARAHTHTQRGAGLGFNSALHGMDGDA
uniref:arginine/serine-rich coiled-coil protein 2-like isoform X2 n=1 Tax=Myxine glutinosa TaxID=7769 RepID=UPI00358FDC8B